MKFTKYFMPFAALALLASCSNDNISEPGEVQTPVQKYEGGNIAFNVCLAPNVETKAVGDRDYDYESGTNEYAIIGNGNGTDVAGYVYIFEGATESAATFKESAAITTSAWETTSDSYLEKVGLATAKANLTKDYTTNGNYWAIVVLNYTTDLAAGWNNTKTIDDFRALNTLPVQDGTYFIMTSAPSYTGSTESGTSVSYAAKIDSNWINNPEQSAANVYVQRVAAKVTVNKNDSYTFNSESVEGGTTKADQITISSWIIDTYNTNSYALQYVPSMPWESFANNALKQRFTAYDLGTTEPHNRIFWGEDANYDENDDHSGIVTAYKTQDGTEVTPSGDQPLWAQWNTNAKYIHENTFDVTSMIKENTTRVLVKAVALPKDLVDGDGQAVAAGTSFFKNVDGTVWTAGSLARAIETVLGLEEDDIEVIEPNNSRSGMSYDNLTINCTSKALETSDHNTIKTELKILGYNLDFYKNGVCYYEMRIRHFSNNETGLYDDWLMDSETYAGATYDNKLNANPSVPGVTAAGTNADQYFLGRYGVVRNNWYDLTIHSISKIGDPTPPTPDDTPDDDPQDKKIKFTVNILSWAKRQHSYDF